MWNFPWASNPISGAHRVARNRYPVLLSSMMSLSKMVVEGIQQAGTDFLFGAPSFFMKDNDLHYFNSAYLVDAEGSVKGKYDKVHLVPFGEYVPLKKWLPFIGKMVEQVGDFQAGPKGSIHPLERFPPGDSDLL